jgi:hypothetical protein
MNDEPEKEIVSDNYLDTECFPEENLQNFVEVDAALYTTEEANEEKTVNFILNSNANETNKPTTKPKKLFI